MSSVSRNPRTPPTAWPPVLALATATFAVVTTEMLPVGLLTSLTHSLHISPGTAGLTLTLPGLIAAISAPLLPVVARHTDRRRTLSTLLLLLAAADLLSALAPTPAVLLLARALVGVCIGGVWSLAAGLPPRLVPPKDTARATSIVFSGIALASVAGVPAGTCLDQLTNWRWSFAALAALATASAITLIRTLPELPPERPVNLGTFPALLRQRTLRRGLLAIAFLVTGHFAAYTYVRPLLERVQGIPKDQISALLLGYGLAGVAGTFAAGATGARTAKTSARTLTALSLTLGTALTLLIPATPSPCAAIPLLLLWGLSYGALSVTAQNWLSATVPHVREAATALFTGIFNTAIAVGALAGGRTADEWGLTPVLGVGATLAYTAALLLLGARAETSGARGTARSTTEAPHPAKNSTPQAD